MQFVQQKLATFAQKGPLKISTLVISDIDNFTAMKAFWDRQMRDHVYGPFLSSSMLVEFWKFCQKIGEAPLFVIFLSDEGIIGFAPLRMKSRFGFRQILSIDQYAPPVILQESYRDLCIDTTINYLFNNLNCESVQITFEDNAANLRMLEKICRKRKLKHTFSPQEGQAIIPIDTSLESFRNSLDKKVKKEFQRIGRRLDSMGSWKISCSPVDQIALDKIWAIEKYSWKANLEGKEKAIKDLGLECILGGVQNDNENEPYFDSEVWFLDLNNSPIAYVLVLKRKKTVFFVKTSYDSRFKKVAPGRFLLNDLIERVFRENAAESIDFISNLSFVRIWNPLVKKRLTVDMSRSTYVLRSQHIVFNNRISRMSLQLFEQLRWKKNPLNRLFHRLEK